MTPPEPPHAEAADAVLTRLRKVEGQIRGLQRMVEERRPCEELLTQVSAVNHALRRVGLMMLSCALADAMAEAEREGRDPKAALEKTARMLAKLG